MKQPKFAGVCAINDGKILLVQEGYKQAFGLWSLPLGKAEENESESEAATRETKEETGYDVELGKSKTLEINIKDFKTGFNLSSGSVYVTIFEAKIISGTLKAGEGMLDAEWFPLGDLDGLPLRGDWIKLFTA